MLTCTALLLALIVASRWMWFSATVDSWTVVLSGDTLGLYYSRETKSDPRTRFDVGTGPTDHWEWWTWVRIRPSFVGSTSTTEIAAWPLLLPPLALAGYLRTRGVLAMLRVPPGCCRSCRYDLRGLDPSAACPECGRTRLVAR